MDAVTELKIAGVYYAMLKESDENNLALINAYWNGTDALDVFTVQQGPPPTDIRHDFTITDPRTNSAFANINRYAVSIIIRLAGDAPENQIVAKFSNFDLIGKGSGTILADIQAGIDALQAVMDANTQKIKDLP